MSRSKMYKYIFIFSILLALSLPQKIFATEPSTGSGLVITRVQTKDSESAKNELIEIYNNSDQVIDITGWSVRCGSKNSLEDPLSSVPKPKPSRKLVPFDSNEVGVKLFLGSQNFLLLASKEYVDSGFKADFTFSSYLADEDRWVAIFDDKEQVIDLVEWGKNENESLTAEGSEQAILPPGGGLIQRRKIEESDSLEFQDTDNNKADFIIPEIIDKYFYGDIFEVFDACLNIPGFQENVPFGYERDAVSGNCYVDLCPNLPGIQEDLPPGYRQDELDNCYLPKLEINELLPDPNGADSNNEFIELFNPHSFSINLGSYVLTVGSKKYQLPADMVIDAYGYLAIYNEFIKFTLVNTTSQVTLESIFGEPIDGAITYSNPKVGLAWAKFGADWRYTNQPTPGDINLPDLVVDSVVNDSSGLAPCAPNQYRNPLTNRCKLLPEFEPQPVPCKEGQYRSEITGRCRNIISDIAEYVPCPEGQERNPETNRCRKIKTEEDTALKPCPEGQERNPETNRCRKIKTEEDTALKPCPEGQERNPETNRCRKIVQMMTAKYKPTEEELATEDKTLIVTLLIVGTGILGFGFWEWRHEIKLWFLWLKNRLK